MPTLLVATDFSTRSDRAIRRAILLARRSDRKLHLIHVVDDDLDPRLLTAEKRAADDVLDEQARTIRDGDGIPCTAEVLLGDPFSAIVACAIRMAAELIVVGPHRRHMLKDAFIGTTAERIIRTSPVPVLMANAVPAGPYRSLTVAIDLAPSATVILETLHGLRLAPEGLVTALHVTGIPGAGVLSRAAVPQAQAAAYGIAEQARARADLQALLAPVRPAPGRMVIEIATTSVAEAICRSSRELATDLLVLGTAGRAGLELMLLGSVAADVLGHSTCDVLTIPENRP